MKRKRWFGGILLLACLTLAGCSKQKAVIPLTTSSDQARELFLQGRALLDAARPTEAHSYFMQAVEHDADFALAHLALGETATTEEERAAAVKRAIGLADRVSLGEREMILAVNSGRRGGSTGRRLGGLVDLYPDDARALCMLGESFAALGDHAKAMDTYRAAIQLDPQLSPAYRRMSDAYRALGRYRQAEGPLAKFVALNPTVANPHGLFAELMMKMGRFEESIASYEKALALDPDFRAAHIGIGNNLIFLERPEDARKTFEKLYESASEDGERLTALSWLAAAHLHREDHEGALAQLEKAQALAGGIGDAVALADVLELMGDVLLESGSEDAARSRYAESAAAVEDSDLTDAVKHVARSNLVYHQARVAIARGEIGTAKAKLAEYRGSLGDGLPGAKDRFNEMNGRVALAEDDRETAVRQLERASPRDPRIAYVLALIYRDLGREQDARKHCRLAAEFNEPEIRLALVRAKARRLLGEI